VPKWQERIGGCMDPKVRRRTRLKSKQSKALRESLVAVFGENAFWDEAAAVEIGDYGAQGIIVVNNEIVGFAGEAPFLTVRGVLKWRPTTRFVTVDMGAIRFVMNGADIMAPGITEADPALASGDWCWIRDEKNGQPLAIGKCVMSGPEMSGNTKGKAVAMIHHIGDKMWILGDS
jgi:PUA-domain protein